MRHHIHRALCLATCLSALPALSVTPFAADSVTVVADNDAKARGGRPWRGASVNFEATLFRDMACAHPLRGAICRFPLALNPCAED